MKAREIIFVCVFTPSGGIKLPASDQHAAAMVDLMLDDLRRKAGKGLCTPLEGTVLIPDRDGLILISNKRV